MIKTKEQVERWYRGEVIFPLEPKFPDETKGDAESVERYLVYQRGVSDALRHLQFAAKELEKEGYKTLGE